MKRSRFSMLVVAASILATALLPSPAQAATVGPLNCGGGGYVSGSTEAGGQITYNTGVSHCGQLGLRVYYSSVAGGLWTPWQYSAHGGGYVSRNVGNSAIKSEHTSSLGSLRFESFR